MSDLKVESTDEAEGTSMVEQQNEDETNSRNTCCFVVPLYILQAANAMEEAATVNVVRDDPLDEDNIEHASYDAEEKAKKIVESERASNIRKADEASQYHFLFETLKEKVDDNITFKHDLHKIHLPDPANGKQRVIYSLDQCNHTSWPGWLRLTEANAEEEGGELRENDTAHNCFVNFGITYDFFHEVFDRNSLDNKGMPMIATVNYAFNFPNALWDYDTKQMVFGDGFVNNPWNYGELCGTQGLFGNYAGALDIVAHELTHGLLAKLRNKLLYENESGALNESVADVMGTMVMQWYKKQDVHQASWLVGEDLLMPDNKGVAMRSLKAPGTAYDIPGIGKDPQPGHMRDFATGAALSKLVDGDHGGVHLNSGIPNHAFYLAAMALGGNSWDRAGMIWYKTIINDDLLSNIKFEGFARLTCKVAGELYKATPEVEQIVFKAWADVGVNAGPAPPKKSRKKNVA